MPLVSIITLAVIGGVVVFVVCRGLLCWYFKLNKIVEHLSGIYKVAVAIAGDRIIICPNKNCGVLNAANAGHCYLCGTTFPS